MKIDDIVDVNAVLSPGPIHDETTNPLPTDYAACVISFIIVLGQDEALDETTTSMRASAVSIVL